MARRYYKAETYEARKSVGYLLRRARNLLTTQVQTLFEEKFVETEITFAQWVVLMCLRDRLATTSAEICQYTCYDTGAFTRLIDQMEQRGLIRRKRSSKDRRVVELQLTPKGRKTVESLIVLVVDYYNELLSGFTHKEADELIRLLSKLVASLSDKRG